MRVPVRKLQRRVRRSATKGRKEKEARWGGEGRGGVTHRREEERAFISHASVLDGG